MTHKEVYEMYAAAAFELFEIILTNGTRVRVDHPEFMSFSRDYRTVYVHQRSGGINRLDVKLIIALDEVKNGARSRRRKR